MEPGVYEQLITAHLRDRLQLSQVEHEAAVVPDADAATVLSRHVGEVLSRRLSGIRTDEQRLALVNRILQHVEHESGSSSLRVGS